MVVDETSAGQRHRRRSATGIVRFGLDRCGGGTAAAWSRLAEGRLLARDQLPAELMPDLARRVEQRERKTCVFVLADGAETAGGRAIVLTQRDIREVQLASGAIRAGIELLLRRHGLRAGGSRRVFVSRRFRQLSSAATMPSGSGSCRRVSSITDSLPWQYLVGRGRLVAGFSEVAERHARSWPRGPTHVDLSRDPDFATAFADAMIFPDV